MGNRHDRRLHPGSWPGGSLRRRRPLLGGMRRRPCGAARDCAGRGENRTGSPPPGRSPASAAAPAKRGAASAGLEPLDLRLRHEPSASHEKGTPPTAGRRLDHCPLARRARARSVGPPLDRRQVAPSYPASAHRPSPCAPRFRCSGAARSGCANRAHSVRKRGPTVFFGFFGAEGTDLQRIWRPRPRNPPQLF